MSTAVLTIQRSVINLYCLTDLNTFSIRRFFTSSDIELYAQAEAATQPIKVACKIKQTVASLFLLRLKKEIQGIKTARGVMGEFLAKGFIFNY